MAANRKPLKPAQGPQLLTIPNREEVLAEFRRCAPVANLINIELERGTMSTTGPVLRLCAFLKEPRLTIEHVIYYRGKIDPKDLLDGARMLAQNAQRETLRRRRPQGAV